MLSMLELAFLAFLAGNSKVVEEAEQEEATVPTTLRLYSAGAQYIKIRRTYWPGTVKTVSKVKLKVNHTDLIIIVTIP